MISNDSLLPRISVPPPDWANNPGGSNPITNAHVEAMYEVLLIASSDRQFAQKAMRAIQQILGTSIEPNW